MNIYISENVDSAIEGFALIPIVYGEVDLRSVPDHGASTIVAIDAVDSIKYENIEKFIGSVCSKLRLNSNLHLGGTDIVSLNKSLISGSINVKDYNNIVFSKKGLYTSKQIIDILISNNIIVKSVIFKGTNYEITATRKQN